MSLTNHTPEHQVQQLFNQIAPQYDRMNSLISLGTHHHWRHQVMTSMTIHPGDFALDVCCGTGDWTLALAQAVGPAGQVVGLDFSDQMLALADRKVRTAGFANRITLKQGDAMQLPYPDNAFNVVTIGFGLRNVPDANQVLSELTRVVKPGGPSGLFRNVATHKSRDSRWLATLLRSAGPVDGPRRCPPVPGL